MAAALLLKEMPRIGVTSAGTHALVGHRADATAVQLMDNRGLDIRGHVSALLTAEHARHAQLILTMTRKQSNFIETNYPFARGKVYRLGEHDDHDVVDPFQRGDFIFDLAMAQIEQGVSHWLAHIARLSN
jgi:protein-tyrosine phosphatase